MTSCRTLIDVDKLDPNDARSPYQQVAERLRQAINAGTYKVGDQLPAHAAVAEQYGVSTGTVKRAFAELQRDRLIVTRQGQRSYVRAATSDGDAPPDADADELRRAVASLARRVDALERRLTTSDE